MSQGAVLGIISKNNKTYHGCDGTYVYKTNKVKKDISSFGTTVGIGMTDL